MKRRILGLALCLALALSLLPVGALAADLGNGTLDLHTKAKIITEEDGQPYAATLASAAAGSHPTIGHSGSGNDVSFDLDNDGTMDLRVERKILSKKMYFVFSVLTDTTVFGSCIVNGKANGSADYYSKLQLVFPEKTAASETVTVFFFEAGGTGTMAAVTAEKNKPYTLPECEFTPPDGKEFDKWDQGAPGETITLTSDITIVALWKDKVAPKNIDTIEITFVNTDLKAGKKPTFEAKLSDESAAMATIKEEVWTEKGASITLSSLGTDNTVMEGHTYSYSIALEPKEGYVFTESTGLKYDGVDYAQSAIGADLKAGGSGLELWDFLPDVEIPGASIDKLEIDLTKGGTIVAEPDCTTLANTLIGANAVAQAKYMSGTIDLDMDGTVDMAFDKSSGDIKLQPSMSLTGDATLTLNDEGINYAVGKYFTPFAKEVEFKLSPAEKTYDLVLSGGPVTLTGDKAKALIGTLQADDNGGLITLNKTGDVYEVDLDKDGAGDMKVTLSGSDVTAEPLATSSVEESITLDSPLYDIILLAGSGDPYLTRLTVYFKGGAAVDRGELIIDLSKEKSVTVSSAEYEAFRASLTGLAAKDVVKSKTEGDIISVDLDKDGKFDIEANGTWTFSLTEDCSLTKDTSITLGEDEIAAIDPASWMEYYKTVTVKIPAAAPKENPFTDVKEGDYFYDAVLWAYYAEPQITDGMTDTTFGPTLTVTRGQCVTFLWRAMGKPEPTITKNPFTDVPASQYYYKAVLWAVEKGITDGVTDTTFAPDMTLSTAHITTFLYRTLGIGTNGWYQEAAAWAISEHLLDGMNLMVAPNVDCPRGAVVTFLYRELG